MSNKQASDSVDNESYTQRKWDRSDAIGKVPEEYKRKINSYEESQRRYDRG